MGGPTQCSRRVAGRDRGQGIVDSGQQTGDSARLFESCAAPLLPSAGSVDGDAEVARELNAKLRKRAEGAREVLVRVGDQAVRTVLLQNFAETMVSFVLQEAGHIYPFFIRCF